MSWLSPPSATVAGFSPPPFVTVQVTRIQPQLRRDCRPFVVGFSLHCDGDWGSCWSRYSLLSVECLKRVANRTEVGEKLSTVVAEVSCSSDDLDSPIALQQDLSGVALASESKYPSFLATRAASELLWPPSRTVEKLSDKIRDQHMLAVGVPGHSRLYSFRVESRATRRLQLAECRRWYTCRAQSSSAGSSTPQSVNNQL